MAHLAAFSYTSEDVLSDSKSAPDGSDSCDHVSENSFESIRTDNEMTNKISVGPAVNHSDISTDSCSDNNAENEYFGHSMTIPNSTRLPIF